MKILLCVLVAMTALTASARLGETEQQLTNRYGAIMEVSTNSGLRTLGFDFGEFQVQARLRNGKSVVEFAYLKKRDVEFGEASALAIASRMAGATNWLPFDSSASEKSWTIKKPGLYASLSNAPGKPHSVMVATVEELHRQGKAGDETDKKKADGF